MEDYQFIAVASTLGYEYSVGRERRNYFAAA